LIFHLASAISFADSVGISSWNLLGMLYSLLSEFDYMPEKNDEAFSLFVMQDFVRNDS
jgi:hypothetical protein